jgi:capsular polysaccharide export protein
MKYPSKAAGGDLRRLFVFSAGFYLEPRLHRILSLAGWSLRVGMPASDDAIGIWGASPTAWRGRWWARQQGCRTVTVEDAFLRSILPGRAKGRIAARGPVGLIIDPHGLHFDPSRPSLIETLVSAGIAPDLRAEAREGIARLKTLDLSKYHTHRPDCAAPEAGYVLVTDQLQGDASLMGASRAEFLEMLHAARAENPGRRIVIRTHPETAAGLRPGHYRADDLQRDDLFCGGQVSPWKLIGNAHAVYAVSSQLGYEAILAGKVPRIFGSPFYAGWGLSEDQSFPATDRRGKATPEEIFAASHLLAPTWYDPCLDQLTDFNGAVNQIDAESKAFRQDRDGHLAYGMRLWKRPFIKRFFGSAGLRFTSNPTDKVTISWASAKDRPSGATLVEDGLLRSRGLGADLTPPLSLIADDLGIYYDPSHESRLERLIAAPLPPGGEARANRLIALIIESRLSKYNLTRDRVPLPACAGPRILIPGQVEDDASIRLGAGMETGNLQLLARVRREWPDAFLIYKPHPDVERGLRPGHIADRETLGLADHVARNADPLTLLDQVDELWTITSNLGFEALLRGIPVTTLGAPFYAGWGLTRDLGPVPHRRRSRPSLAHLIHACLIDYPRYLDPVSGLPCPPEVAIRRLSLPSNPQNSTMWRILAKARGALSGHSWLWRG